MTTFAFSNVLSFFYGWTPPARGEGADPCSFLGIQTWLLIFKDPDPGSRILFRKAAFKCKNGHCSLGTFDRRATTRPGIAQHSIGWIRCAARAYAWTWAASWALAARKSCWGRRNSNGSSRNRWWFPATRWGWILSLIYGYLKTKTNNVLQFTCIQS